MTELKPIIENQGKSLIIAGPCSAESRDQTLDAATSLAAGGVKVFRAGLWKPRTKPGCFEGVGTEGLDWLAEVKRLTGMAVATEVATATHVEEALKAGVDILWLGARTTTNPFAVQEIADALKADDTSRIAILVKNPVNPDLELWIGALERIFNAGVRRLGAIHRGFSTYGTHTYRNMPMWQIPIELRRRLPELPIICDPSHIGGKREFILEISQKALDMGFDGLIVESHPEPDKAKSDASQQLTPEALLAILGSLNYRHTKLTDDNLSLLRRQIDTIDSELIDLLERRMSVSREIGRYKKSHGVPVVQASRYDDIMASRIDAGVKSGMAADFMRNILAAIHAESVRQQIESAGD